MLTCTDIFVPVGSASLAITVDAGLAPQGCQVSFLAVVAFTRPVNSKRVDPASVPPATLLCPSDNTLVPLDSICDGLEWNCPDGSDELCQVFRLVETNVDWSSTIAFTAAEFPTG